MSFDIPRIAFVTGHQFGRRALEGLISSNEFIDGTFRIALSISLDSSRAGATVGFAGIEDVCEMGEHQTTTDGSLRACIPALEHLDIDYLLVVGWSRLVHPDVLDLFKPRGATHYENLRAIGMHPTKLPAGRGQAPIPWTIIKGLRSTALTVFGLSESADSGPVIAQYETTVRAGETSSSLFSRIAHLHYEAGADLAGKIARREVSGAPQDESKSSVWGKRRPADGIIMPSMSRVEIDTLVRALQLPYPRARVMVGGSLRMVTATNYRHDIEQLRHGEIHEFSCIDGPLSLSLLG